MKRFFLTIFYFFVNFRKRITFKGFETKLKGALQNKFEEQYKLIKEIKAEIDKLYPKSRSKFIPLSFPQRMEIKAKVYARYGNEMQRLHIKLNNHLQIK
jgi:hypothetical protein